MLVVARQPRYVARRMGVKEAMDEVVKVEIPVEPETARALCDARRVQAIGRLVDRMVRPVRGDDPLVAILEATRRAARQSGLTDKDIDDELEAYRAERPR
jgi:hypothetical protein